MVFVNVTESSSYKLYGVWAYHLNFLLKERLIVNNVVSLSTHEADTYLKRRCLLVNSDQKYVYLTVFCKVIS